MTPAELRDIIDDLVACESLALRITKGRALHLVVCRLLTEQQKPQEAA